MNKRTVVVRPLSIIAVLAMAFAASLSAQPAVPDGPVVITAPAAWTTLRSDSVTVSVQADLDKLPKGTIDFKVVRRSGTRANTVITKSVKMEEAAADVFLGRVKELPVGGNVYLSVEWSVPGSSLKGVVEPVGIVKLFGEMTAGNKWVPAQPPQTAVRLADGISGAQAAEALSATPVFDVGGLVKFSAGWNPTGLFIRFVQPSRTAVVGIDFAFDMKCGKNAFLAWADRFARYNLPDDSVSGKHIGNRTADSAGIKFEELKWGSNNSPGLEKAGDARVVMVRWPDLGVQPFEERSIGFAVFVSGRTDKSYPAAADRNIPGTWGDLKLAK
ncbi:MAG: hypothetical protein FWB85_10455 [Chitinispirillia bacterium]|nr:hypothetical protein [Chitinispirillia bacterium]MCL2242635.1 hypothetical protein [Chitinispirillia bacterium]